MKETFTACGIRFNTQSAIDGFVRLNSRESIEAWCIDSIQADHFAGKILDEKHPELAKRFVTLKSKFKLDSNAELLLSNYGYPSAMRSRDKVIMDVSALQLLTPDEADAICAHELAHMECSHTYIDSDVHAVEHEADRISKERIGSSDALCSGLQKLTEFNNQLAEASYRYKALLIASKIAHKVHQTIGGTPKNHPPHGRAPQPSALI